ncbi:hypothetical protein [Streptomyces sp. NPDC050704]|uniref:hypothetical protein n=1 Tax=Streptomyces sp. NPDC050704 TaxID=3157219 RepID=UPI00342779B5
MKRRRRILTTLLVALGMAAMVAPSTTAAAPSADTAWVLRTQYLVSNPEGGDVACTESRRIYLASGSYNWGLRIGGNQWVTRDMSLGAGWYRWQSCLNPEYDDYIHTSVLVPENPDWGPAATSRTSVVNPSGTYTWGSFLDPRF